MNDENLRQIDDLSVKILLSTYNGEKFLGKLLDSLLAQNYHTYKIIIRDDGSTDTTLSILKEYKRKHPEIIEIIDSDSHTNLGVKKSFELLLRSSEADYYFFCDQDDLWEPDKIFKLVKMLHDQKEERSNLLLLALSDFSIFTGDKEILIESYYKKVRFKVSDLENKLFVCLIPGCCFGFNHKAKKLFFEYSTNYLHDGHLFLLTQLFGKVLLDESTLLKYRLHTNNVVGYWKKSKPLLLIKDFFKYLTNKKKYRDLLLKDYNSNIEILYKQIDNDFLKKNEVYLTSELNSLSFLSRKKWYIKHFKPFKKGLYQGVMEILTF